MSRTDRLLSGIGLLLAVHVTFWAATGNIGFATWLVAVAMIGLPPRYDPAMIVSEWWNR